ncbi:PEP-CTERM sorting domain-containing protein [Adhaeretor mobilis]|uniref:Ice-binding protein C-terminal domain-containing protein n=1 Tax=Adhaeretor mobilis TaxID=1930276 RepID=A0A517MPH0_9BACT|nr:PEP-CTERM sorting domain-containing protein [Adhaeretor mobilis]QDS96764.1 hypothetical protein HG15A2_00220 [Adhaeretor mobilis]
MRIFPIALLPSILLSAAVLSAGTNRAAAVTTTLQAALDWTTVKVGDVEAPFSPATATAEFVLNVPGPTEFFPTTASYRITLSGLDLDGNQTQDSNDNVTAIHLHDLSAGIAANGGSKDGIATGGTQHALNIYGFPGNNDPVNNPEGGDDDNNIEVFAVDNLVTGVWDDSDAVDRSAMAPGLGSTFAITAPGVIENLLAGNMYLMIHTSGSMLPGGVAIGGYLTAVPEPSTALLGFLGLGVLVARRPCRK